MPLNIECHKIPTACAWCEREAGIQTTGSHGCCPKHFEQVAQELRELLARKVRV